MSRPVSRIAAHTTIGDGARWVVSRKNLLHNLSLLRQAAGSELVAVVKANAYGHGMTGVADALFSGDEPTNVPAAFAVASLGEALALPSHDVPTMCLRPAELVWAFGGDEAKRIDEAIRRGVWLSVISPEAAGDVARRAERLGSRAMVQVMLDTGMSREMCVPERFSETIDAVLRQPALKLVGLGTHLTDGELADEPYSDDQIWLFHEALAPVEDRLPRGVVRHVANSGGTLAGHGAADGCDLARVGLALYGIHPDDRAVSTSPLKPVGKLVAPILALRDVPAGASVGYNRTFVARRPTRIALLPVGYADGYPRALSGQAVVRLPRGGQDDVFCPVVGRVSMDYVTIDVTDLPDVRPGDEVVLFDDDPTSPCSVQSLATRCGTIPYELLCHIGNRVRREVV
ncbi:MAG: alanine racemase [Planctomycetota bacterium]